MRPIRVRHRTLGCGCGRGRGEPAQLPGLVREIARQLNQFGSVVVSPGGIEYDGDEVAWSKVTEIRTRRLVGYLFTGAITKQVDRLPVWWFPGRGLVLNGLTHAALTAVAVVTDLRLDSGAFTVYIPAEVKSKGIFRTNDMSPASRPRWCWPTRGAGLRGDDGAGPRHPRSCQPTTTRWNRPSSGRR